MSLNISASDLHELPTELEKRLDLLAEHILLDQNKGGLRVNLKLISSKEMIELNKEFREKDLDTNVLSFPVSNDIQKITGELGDIAMSISYIRVTELE